MTLTITAGAESDRRADEAFANLEVLANSSPIEAYVNRAPELKTRFEAVGRSTRRPTMPSVKDMQQTDTQTFQTSRQTSQPGTVGNAQTSQTFQTLGPSGGKQTSRHDGIALHGSIYTAETLDDVPMHDMDYVPGWKPELPRQAVTALVGPKRSGKSTLALKIAADVSNNGTVLIVQREDPLFIVKSRLKAMGANMDHIRMFTKTTSRRGIDVRENFGAKDLDAIIQVAEGVKPLLVVIDPLHGLAKGDWNRQDAADCLIDLTSMAQNLDCAVLGVLHDGKDQTADVDISASGSDQWIAKCRSHLALGTPPDDDMHAVLQQVSVSYAKGRNRYITFSEPVLTGDDGKTYTVRIVTDMQPTEQTVTELRRLRQSLRTEPVDPDQLPEIARWMYDTIKAKGTHVFATDMQQWAKAKGYSPNQLRLAYRQAGVGQTRQKCARPRSILYLKDLCSAEDARTWGTGTEPENDEKSGTAKKTGKSVKSQ